MGKQLKNIAGLFNYFLYYKNILKVNRKFQNKYKGKRCFIVGNAPSLAKHELSLLENEYTITVNSLMSTDLFDVIKPKFHIVVQNLRFVENDSSLYGSLESITTLRHKPVYVFPVKHKKYVDRLGLQNATDIMYFAKESKLRKLQCVDFTKIIPDYSNVANLACLLAIYLGFTKIYLVGVELSGFVKTYSSDSEFTITGHYYNETSIKNETKDVMNLAASTSNEKFFEMYLETFQSFRLINDFAKRRNVEIYNATIGGILDVFPRVKYESLF